MSGHSAWHIFAADRDQRREAFKAERRQAALEPKLDRGSSFERQSHAQGRKI